jgi:hypothetical protein
MTYLSQLGILPALLITLGGLLLLHSETDDAIQRRFLNYLLIVGALLLLALSVAIWLTPAQDNRPYWPVTTVLIPAFVGVLALLVLHTQQVTALSRWAQLLALLLSVGLAVMLVRYRGTQFELAYLIVPGVLVLALGWFVGRRYRTATIILGCLSLLALFGLNLLFNAPPDQLSPPQWLRMLVYIVFIALPGLIVVLIAVLFTNGLQSHKRLRALPMLVLGLGLLGYLIYSIFWASVWDQTSDGLGGLSLSQPAALVAVGAGMLMATTLTGRQRGLGLLFTLLVPVLLLQAFERGWQTPYHDLTEARAERIAQALADYRQREGVYPSNLAALTPRDLWRIPQPVELQGETWCYESADDFYRLGAFSREFFSMPVNLHLYAAEGEPDGVWACQEQVAAMQARYYSPMADPAGMQPPLPTPLPPNTMALESETLTPLLGENGIVWGSWSPDSAWFLFGRNDSAGNVTFSFLDGQTGDLCEVPGAYPMPPMVINLRSQHAWLPDGQLLLLDGKGQIAILTPCSNAARSVMPQTTEIVTEIMAHDETGSHVLFKSATAYWIFDGQTLTWQLIPAVTPNPYEAHWDNADWQPDGKQLALSRLNGRDAEEGSTLYIIDGTTGAVLRSVPLDAATAQSAARVDWLTPQELLLSSSGVLHILDLSSDTPQTTAVLTDLFGLDLAFPDDVGGNGWEVDWANGSYILTVQANHPRNRALYLYDSATGMVDVYAEEANLLLRYPDGQLEQWLKPDAEPTSPDAFVLIDVADGTVYPPLTLSGHTPRDYPRLSMVYLAETAQLAVASSQGVSLHTLPGGEMTRFWTLAGQGFAPFLLPTPDRSALVTVRDLGGVYWIPVGP